MGKSSTGLAALQQRIEALERENAMLRRDLSLLPTEPSVTVPEPMRPLFDVAQETVREYFKDLRMDPSKGTIEINEQRYVLVRASAFSKGFLETIQRLYADKGESEGGNGKLHPSAYKSLQKGADGFDYIEPSRFHADFAADLPAATADFEANAQMPAADAVFHAVIQNPAWKTKPSWYMVAKSDRIINPDLERLYAKRAKSQKVEIAGASHSVYESHPKEVAKLIIEAAKHSGH